MARMKCAIVLHRYQLNQYRKQMRTKGDVEEAICKIVTEFEKATFGKGPLRTRTFLTDTLITVHVQFGLLPWEDVILQRESGGDDLRSLKRKVIDVTIDQLQYSVEQQVQIQVECGFHDTCVQQKERVYMFRLTSKPPIAI